MLYEVITRVLAPTAKMIYRPTVEGRENIPRRGKIILASNHRAAVDSAVIPLLAGRPVAFLAKAEYFESRKPRQRAFGAFLGALGHVPVKRGQGRAALVALEVATDVLTKGGAFGIYPEGTRSLDGRLHRGHTGVAQLALTTGAKVIPVGLIGTDKMQPVGKRFPRVCPITVRFGAPLDFSRYEGLAEAPVIRRSVTDEIMYAIMELSGQEYVDAYHQRPQAA
ncbi:MAG TPA: lysophospholipid acyltransferase family protein [Pseudonocardiaceae bacterium]|nr:lysophospholipid acyltransferase family protein [Pseudonocardiaceae bacterium]